MKKLFGLMLLFLSASLLFAAPAAEEEVSIGISKIVAHPALDAVEQGIQDGLAERGYTDVVYDLQNANGDMGGTASVRDDGGRKVHDGRWVSRSKYGVKKPKQA